MKPVVGYFVAPHGSANAAGTRDDPWSYEHAFAGAGGTIRPGDTVWFRDGTYPISAPSAIRVEGTGETSRVVFRPYPGERAVFATTTAGDHDWITVYSKWLTVWGLEFTNTDPDRNRNRGRSLYNYGNCNRYLNIVVHDGGVGFYAEPSAYGTELIGSIFYNNGWETSERGSGHAMYIKSNVAPGNACRPGQARIVVRDNVAFNQFGYGVHAYTDRAEGLSGMLLEGNVVFNNGSVANSTHSEKSSNFLLAGDASVLIVNSDTVRANMSYYSPATKLQNPGAGIRVGYTPGAWSSRHDHAVVTNNYTVGGSMALRIRNWDTITVTGNVASGPNVAHLEDAGLANYTWNANTYIADAASPSWFFNAPPAPEAAGVTWDLWKAATGLGGTDAVTGPPASPKVFVRPLAPYASGRGHIVIYNWSMATSVPVDLSAVLAPGDSFAVWNVQDLFATSPVLAAIYHGGTVNIPMTGVAPPPPLGGARTPPRTAPEFDVFVVQKR
ncbi:MAG: hypothetical protein ABR537_05895 [Gemmatimonadales bacterium]